MRLLAIEDDRRVAWLLQRGLRARYTVEIARDGVDGLFRATHFDYDAIILDLNLPGMPGDAVCRAARQQRQTVPILILTGQDDPERVVQLLDAGADDYLTKPFRLDEVLARLRAVMRRVQAKADISILRAGDLELDTARRTVRRGNQPVALRRREFDLLEYFMYNQSRTLTREMIIEHVWDDDSAAWGNVVDVHVKHLRDKMDRPFARQLIQTVRGVGYKLEAQAEGAVANT